MTRALVIGDIQNDYFPGGRCERQSFGCTVAHDARATLDLEFAGATIPAAGVHGAFMDALGGGYANVVSSDDV
jgi:hypothetical protein